MARLSNGDRERAVCRLNAGQSIVEVARAFGCSKHRTQVQQNESAADLPRSGTPRVTSLA